MSDIARRANTRHPCAVCQGGTKGCSATADGLHFCRGLEVAPGGWFDVLKGAADDAGFHHFRRRSDDRPPVRVRLSRNAPSTNTTEAQPSATDWPAMARRYADALPPELKHWLAASLGLPADGLDCLPLVGARTDDPHATCTTWPEMNPAGEVIGINRRWKAGTGLNFGGEIKDKVFIKGGNRGLTLPTGWLERGKPGDPVFVVEGPTDCAAMTAAGLSCVGRPSANGGAGLLAELFAELGDCRPVFAVGENDQKEDGLWPGRQGAGQVGVRLAELLGKETFVAMPPAETKDARAWLTHPNRGGTPWHQRGRQFADLLLATAEPRTPPPQPTTERNRSPSKRPTSPRDEPDNPHRLAEGYLLAVDPDGRPRTFRCRAGEFVEWVGGAYRTLTDEDVKARLTTWVRGDFLQVWEREWDEWDESAERDPDSEKEPVVRKVSIRLLGDVLNAVRAMVLLPSDIVPPCWIDGATGPEPRGILAMPNGLLDIPTGRLLPPTPLFFTSNAVTFDYDPAPPPPKEWLRFLRQLWPDDPESIECLRQWFGYLLTQDTTLQKLLMLIGPKRGGKGTITRVLKALIGARNFASPTLSSLTTEFGLSSLLNKSVAVIPDARFTGRADLAGIVVERLLSITGEDTVDVNRKYLPILSVKLHARFVIVSNELPRLSDSSGALAGRMVLLRLTQTFYGDEDIRLTDKLLSELPGILRWSLDGWKSLRADGRFIEPLSGRELKDDMHDLSSPVGAFVREQCILGPQCRVEVGELFAAWERWCQANHRRESGTI